MVARHMVMARIRLTKKQEFIVLGLVTSITGIILASAMYLVLSSELIMGWDTPAYIYLTRVLAEIGLQRFLELTTYGSNGLLYYFLLYVSHVATGESLFVLEQVLTSLLFGGIMMSVALVTYEWTRSTHLALVSLPFAIVWPAPYILASNLHSNLLGFLFILLALAFLPDGLSSSLKTYLVVIMLMVLASFSHPQSAAYFGVVIAISSSLAMIVNVHRKALFLKVVFLLFASFTQIFLSVVLSGQLRIIGPLLYPALVYDEVMLEFSVTWGLHLLAFILLPLVILSSFLMLNRVLKSYRGQPHQRELIIYLTALVWAISTYAFWFLSYLFPIFGSYAERLLFIFPVPLLLTVGFAKIWGDLSQRKQK